METFEIRNIDCTIKTLKFGFNLILSLGKSVDNKDSCILKV